MGWCVECHERSTVYEDGVCDACIRNHSAFYCLNQTGQLRLTQGGQWAVIVDGGLVGVARTYDAACALLQHFRQRGGAVDSWWIEQIGMERDEVRVREQVEEDMVRLTRERAERMAVFECPYALLRVDGGIEVASDPLSNSAEEIVCSLTRRAPLRHGAVLSESDAVALRTRFKTEVLRIPYAFEAHVWRGDDYCPWPLDILWETWQENPTDASLVWVTPEWAKARPVLAALDERTLFHEDRVANDRGPFVTYSILTPKGQVLNTRVGRLRSSEVRCPLIRDGQLFADTVYNKKPQYPGATLDMTDAIALRERFKTELLGIPADFEVQVYDSEHAQVPVTLDALWALWQSLPDARKQEWIASRKPENAAGPELQLVWVARRWFGYCAYQRAKPGLLRQSPERWALFLNDQLFCVANAEKTALDELERHHAIRGLRVPKDYYLVQILP